MDGPAEPAATSGAFSATIKSDFFLWGSSGSSDDLSHLYKFASTSRAWEAKQTTGTPPPGFTLGCSASLDDTMYTYGGWGRDDQETGCLLALNTETLAWQLLSEEGPMKKVECAMAAVREMLVLFGGGTHSPADIRPGSQFSRIRNFYYTNELQIYDLKKRELALNHNLLTFYHA